MWTKTRSLMLSRILVAGLFFLLCVLVICIPFIAKWFDAISVGKGLIKGSVTVPVCIMLYICDIFAFAAVISLNRLLGNINRDSVFTEENTRCLRIISWSCVFAGITFAVFSVWRFEFLFAAFFACFLGLVMRVLKNVFEKAVEIKSENDFTI
ncbi:MAG: DUF2975 domain-containing protein [Ruminococcus sp.]|nr:DUF2975 domain-containing protein [Ruminococcus sp.]